MFIECHVTFDVNHDGRRAAEFTLIFFSCPALLPFFFYFWYRPSSSLCDTQR